MGMLAALALAFACEPEPLHLRTVQPAEGATDVPVDVRIAVSFIGYGTADEFEVRLAGAAGEVATDRSTWCYAHEGVAEVHCWHSLTPRALLEAGGRYQVQVESTERWSGEGAMRLTTSFVTGSSTAPVLVGPPALTVLDAWDEVGATDCEYPLARRYEFRALPGSGVADPSALSLFHLYPEAADGMVGDNVHTLFVTNPGDTQLSEEVFKQYLDGASAWSDCFWLEEESAAGVRSSPVRGCFEEEDTGEVPDTGDPGDTGVIEDSGSAGETGDGGLEGDTAVDEDPPPAERGGQGGASGCPDSCAGGPGILLLAWLVALPLGRRRRRSEPPAEDEAATVGEAHPNGQAPVGT
jgi:hypothetical protein